MKIDKLNKIFTAIVEYAKFDNMQIYFPEITINPRGIKQDSDIGIFDHEYVDQKTGLSCDDYYGTIYYPIGKGYYLAVQFSM